MNLLSVVCRPVGHKISIHSDTPFLSLFSTSLHYILLSFPRVPVSVSFFSYFYLLNDIRRSPPPRGEGGGIFSLRPLLSKRNFKQKKLLKGKTIPTGTFVLVLQYKWYLLFGLSMQPRYGTESEAETLP